MSAAEIVPLTGFPRESEEREAGWATQIRTEWRKSIESILRVGQLLIRAKADLPHGSFEKMVGRDLPFSTRTAQMLMAIAKNPVLVEKIENAKQASRLPASWTTLYELSRWDEQELRNALGGEHPKVRADTPRSELPDIRKFVQKVLSGDAVQSTGTSTAETGSEVGRLDHGRLLLKIFKALDRLGKISDSLEIEKAEPWVLCLWGSAAPCAMEDLRKIEQLLQRMSEAAAALVAADAAGTAR